MAVNLIRDCYTNRLVTQWLYIIRKLSNENTKIIYWHVASNFSPENILTSLNIPGSVIHYVNIEL